MYFGNNILNQAKIGVHYATIITINIGERTENMQVFNSISTKKVLYKHFDFHLYCFELSSKSKLAASLRGSFSSKNTLPLII